VAVYEVTVANSEDPHRKTEMLGKIADIHERRLANFEAAFDAYARALRIDPGNPEVIAHLDRLSEVTGRWADLATAYEAEVERVNAVVDAAAERRADPDWGDQVT
jgi:hypothetical protein